MIERRKEALADANRLLTAFVDNKFVAGMDVPAKAKKVGLSLSNYHTALRRLRVLGRLSKGSKPRELPKILNAAPVSEREYLELGDPYSRSVPKRVAKKVGRPKRNHGILTAPIDFPVEKKIEEEEYTTSRDVTVTIVGAPDAIVAFFRRVGRA